MELSVRYYYWDLTYKLQAVGNPYSLFWVKIKQLREQQHAAQILLNYSVKNEKEKDLFGFC